MGNIINDVGGTTDWSGLTEIKFDSGYEIKCSSLNTTVTGTFNGIHVGTYNNVKGFIRNNVELYPESKPNVLHNDITFMQYDHQYWKLVRYYWNPETQEIYIENTDGTDSLPRRTYINDVDGSLIGGDNAIVGTLDDLTPDIINDSFGIIMMLPQTAHISLQAILYQVIRQIIFNIQEVIY